MKNWINKAHIEGRVFSHTLQEKVAGEQAKNPGVPFIRGILQVATDEEGINIVPVRFFISAVSSKTQKPNESFKVLKQIIDEDKTWENNGKDEAPIIRIDGDVAVNDFLGRDDKMVETKEVRGSFIHFCNAQYPLNKDENKRNTFDTDMLIAATIDKEVEDGDDYLQIRGYAFAYRNALVPVTYTVYKPGAIKYFQEKEISNANPLLTRIQGNIISTTQEVRNETASAFGDVKVDITTRTLRAWVVDWAPEEPYMWDDESTITVDEFKNLLNERAATVAAEEKRQREYQASRGNNGGGKSAFAETDKKADTPSSVADFKF